jgi:hypothetical protein
MNVVCECVRTRPHIKKLALVLTGCVCVCSNQLAEVVFTVVQGCASKKEAVDFKIWRFFNGRAPTYRPPPTTLENSKKCST